MRLLLLVLAFAVASLAFAQRCEAELEAAAARLPAELPIGAVAAELLSGAVHLVEPTLPKLIWSANVPVEPGAGGYEAARYLAERGLLPSGWQPDELSDDNWESMLASFLGWYGLSPTLLPADPDPARLVSDLAYALDHISKSVRPLALIASDSEVQSDVSFLGLVWNWTVYPRLIVMRPQPGQSLDEGVEPLLAQLSNCAIEVEHYVYAPEDTARSLFLTHADARMYVIGSEPELPSWPMLVPEGEEEQYFAFDAPVVRGLVAYAAAFDGSKLGVRSLMMMLPRLRTNLPPTRIPGLFRTPVIE